MPTEILPHITRRVIPRSSIYTDELASYDRLGNVGYQHRRIHPSQQVVMGNIHTNTIEGFFSLVKRGIGGTYHAVSRKWLQGVPEGVRLAVQPPPRRAADVRAATCSGGGA